MTDKDSKEGQQRIRLQKFLAKSGLCSRRKAEEIIQEGKIKVNSEIITEKVFFVNPEKDLISYQNRLVKLPKKKILLAFNKPRKVLCSRKTDQLNKKTVYDFLPGDLQTLSYVGRLDFDSEGLLLFTNDGDLLNLIAHPSNGKKKTYLAWLSKKIEPRDLEKLSSGVALSDGLGKFLKIEVLKKEKSLVKIAVNEGRKRFIRRMLKELGYLVKRLKRIQVDQVSLEDLNLRTGEYKIIRSY